MSNEDRWYIAKMVSVHYIKFEARSKAEARKRAEKMMDHIYKQHPCDHKREYFVTDVFEDD